MRECCLGFVRTKKICCFFMERLKCLEFDAIIVKRTKRVLVFEI